MKDNTTTLYQIYQKRHQELLGLAQAQSSVVKALNLDEIQTEGTKQGEVINGLIKRLESDKLRVLVVGRFSAGKSTFINALFGQPVLPASPTPTTGVLCEIRYADDENKRAVLFPKKGLGQNNDDSPFEIKLSNLQKELGKYVKIDHFGDLESIYQKLELDWPLSLCQNGVELIDSVGLDDPDARDEITLKYAKSADAILYCLKSQDAYSAKDKQVLGLLKSLGYQSIFFIVTYYDHVKDSVEMGETTEEQFRQVQYKNLAPWTELKQNGIKFVDSKSALKGRIRVNSELVQISGIVDVEKSLESFLVQEKGRAKLLTTLSSLRSVNRSARQVIPSRIAMLQTSIEKLEERYKNAEQPLKNLETKRQLMVGQVGTVITDISRNAYDLADEYFIELPDKINNWVANYKIEKGVGFPPRKSTIEPIVEEIGNYIKDKIKEGTAQWNKEELSPMIESKVQFMQDSLESDAREFVEGIDKLRIHLSVGEQLDNDNIAQQKEPSMLGRLMAGGYTLLTGDVLTGGIGMSLGIKSMVPTIGFEIIGGVILGVLGLFNPIGIAIAAISAILAGSFVNILSLKNGIKKTVGKKLSEEIGKRRKELCKKVESEVKDELDNIKKALDLGLEGEISSVRDEVETILDERKKGQLDAEREIQKLRDLEKENVSIEEKLESLIYETGAIAT